MITLIESEFFWRFFLSAILMHNAHRTPKHRGDIMHACREKLFLANKIAQL